jgi:lysylphosphatidylglycerol synthetase-like protein (DUF2156 family)
MKMIKFFSKILAVAAFACVLPLQAAAGEFTVSPKTSDSGFIGIAIAVAACIVTAFVTLRLTKYKNKK